MTRPIERETIYRGRRLSAETIELCVRWYTTYRLSYRDLAAMMAEREVIVAHTKRRRESVIATQNHHSASILVLEIRTNDKHPQRSEAGSTLGAAA